MLTWATCRRSGHATARAAARLAPIEQRVALYARRHNVKPGITGWAQVNGLRGETSTEELMRQRVEHDLYYIDNWSFGFDLKIIFRTVLSPAEHRNSTSTWVILGIIIVLVLWAIATYNSLVAMAQRVNQSFADIDVQLKQRGDLIPNLVETVKRATPRRMSAARSTTW